MADVLKFPQKSELDKQYEELERQEKLIAEQTRKIAELLEGKKPKNCIRFCVGSIVVVCNKNPS